LAAFRDSLEDLGLTRAGELTIVPGNHDIFPVTKKPPFVNPGRPTKNWERFCDLFASSRRGRGGRQLVRGEPFPIGKVLDDNVVLAVIDSTRNRCYDPRMWATGELPDHHIDAVADFFSAHPKARHKVVVMHHCPWAPLEASERKFLPMGMAAPDWETAVNWLQWAGATLVLCGHYHVDVEEADLGHGLTGFCAGTSGGADDPYDRRLFHIIKLADYGKISIKERLFAE
jgi:hypothetical protein